MNYDLQFTGDFNKLKDDGYEFMKLYANNYKVYKKQIPRSFSIWVWVANGGYIEIDDIYSNTKAVVEAMRSINWDNDPEVKTSEMFKERYVRIRFNHNHPDRGAKVFTNSFDLEIMLSMPEAILKDSEKYIKYHQENYDKVREYYDREICVWEGCCKQLLTELNKISK